MLGSLGSVSAARGGPRGFQEADARAQQLDEGLPLGVGELGGELELHHGRLRTADNLDNEVTRWRVAADGTRARLERTLADPSLQVPTTLVRRGGTLYVVRSQFDKGGPLGEGTPEIPFTIAAVRGL